VTLDAFAEAWGHGAARLVGKKWERGRLGLLRKHVLPLLGSVVLPHIRPSDLWQVQKRMLEAGLAARTVNRCIMGAFAALLRDAELDQLIAPEHRIRLLAAVRKVPETRNPERAPFTRQEWPEIVAGFAQKAVCYRAYVAFSVATGMRPGEVLGLQWRDLELAARRCRIERSRNDVGEVTACKTAGAQRTIPLTRAAVAALAGLERADGYVFTGPNGTPLDAHNFRSRHWVPVLRDAAIPYRPPACMRHTFISWQVEAGKPASAIARYCGTSVEMIRRHYYSPTVELDAEDWDDGAVAPVVGLARVRHP